MAENNGISLKEVKRKRKLYAAFANLKLSVFEAQNMCVIDERVETAAWAFDLKDKKGKILIGAKILDSWSVHEIEKAIEHEFLHFSVYSAFRNQYEALNLDMPEIFNITSDGAIWKAILETSGSYVLQSIFKKLKLQFPENPFLIPINPFIVPDTWGAKRQWKKAEEILGAEKTEKLKQIWKDVHHDANLYKASIALKELAKKTADEGDGKDGKGKQGGQPGGQGSGGGGGGQSQPQGDQQPQPSNGDQQQQDGEKQPQKSAAEYAKDILDKEDKYKDLNGEFSVRRIPEGFQIDEDDIESEPDAMMASVEDFLSENKRDFERFLQDGSGGGFSDMLSKAFKIFKVSKKKITTDSLRKFIERMKVKQTLEECSSTIKSSMLPSVSRTQPFMYNLSRLGITYQSIGLSGKIIPLWWNKTPENAKPKLAIYVDTSGSMDVFKSETVFLIGDLISDIPSKIFWFSGSVGEMSAKDFAAGNYRGGGCTSFDAVMEHFLKLKDYQDCIIITDGESSVDDENVRKLKRARKTVYACYMVQDGRYSWSGNYTDTLKSVAKASFILKKKRS